MLPPFLHVGVLPPPPPAAGTVNLDHFWPVPVSCPPVAPPAPASPAPTAAVS